MVALIILYLVCQKQFYYHSTKSSKSLVSSYKTLQLYLIVIGIHFCRFYVCDIRPVHSKKRYQTLPYVHEHILLSSPFKWPWILSTNWLLLFQLHCTKNNIDCVVKGEDILFFSAQLQGPWKWFLFHQVVCQSRWWVSPHWVHRWNGLHLQG